MSFLQNIQNLPEASRKRIALGVTLLLTFLFVLLGYGINILLQGGGGESPSEMSNYEENIFYEEAKSVSSDILFHVWLGWDDISRKVFSN
jgi:hypothetical protein